MGIKEIVKKRIDDITKRLHWYIYYELIPDYIINEYNHVPRPKYGQYNYLTDVKFNDPYTVGRIFNINSTRDYIYYGTSYELHMELLNQFTEVQEIDIPTNLSNNIYFYQMANCDQKHIVMYYNIAYDSFKLYETFGENLYSINSRKDNEVIYVDDEHEDLLEQEMVDDFAFLVAIMIRKLVHITNKIDLVLVQEINDIKLKRFTDKYKGDCRDSVLSQLSDLEISVDLNIFSTFEFLNKHLPLKQVEYIIKQVNSIYQDYGDYFSFRGSGRLLLDYKNTIIETFKANSNTVYGTRYTIDWMEVASIKALVGTISNEDLDFDIELAKRRAISVCNMKYGLIFEDMKNFIHDNEFLLRNEGVYKAFFTSEWSINNIGLIEYVDNTFVCSGYFKCIEILLYNLIKHYFDGVLTPSKYGDYYISNESGYVDLGKMIYFLEYHNRNQLFMRSDIIDILIVQLNDWRKNIRNGYFHKDMLQDKDVQLIRQKTYELIYFILFIQPNSKGVE